jgi:3-oxoacyl-[acyl-carrier-protein] synthase-3
MRAVIRGTGMHLPANVVDNDRLSRVMDTSDDWIRQRTGIVTRHFADLDQATSDLALPAAEAALQDAGLEKHEIDYMVFAFRDPGRSSRVSSVWVRFPASTFGNSAPAFSTDSSSPMRWFAPVSTATCC